jgi:hypothetical protein
MGFLPLSCLPKPLSGRPATLILIGEIHAVLLTS